MSAPSFFEAQDVTPIEARANAIENATRITDLRVTVFIPHPPRPRSTQAFQYAIKQPRTLVNRLPFRRQVAVEYSGPQRAHSSSTKNKRLRKQIAPRTTHNHRAA